MKSDRKLFVAILILIGLVAFLIVLSLNRSSDVSSALRQIEEIKKQQARLVVGNDGKTPIFGIDYFNGKDSISTHTIIQVPIPGAEGKQGPKGDQGAKGDTNTSPPPKLIIGCINGLLMNKYEGDLNWTSTNIKCEVAHE